MTEIDNDEPNQLLDCQIRVVEVEQDHLGILDLEIVEGFVSFMIDRKVAAVLISELAIFMAAEEVDEVQQVQPTQRASRHDRDRQRRAQPAAGLPDPCGRS